MRRARVARVMGCELVVEGGDFEAALGLFRRRERIFSHFEPRTEINRVNATRSTLVRVSDEFARALRTALRAAASTDGRVDPTVGTAVVAGGYGRWRELELDGNLLWRPCGVVLDLNGIVKSQAVDDALHASGARLVAAGDDVAISQPTVVALRSGGTVALARGGVATCSRPLGRRLWQQQLVDPTTGRPAVTPWDEVTVAAGSCVEAGVAAKAAFLFGDTGREWLDGRGIPGRFRAGSELIGTAAWTRTVSGTVDDTASRELSAHAQTKGLVR